jgi:hypothetical protein
MSPCRNIGRNRNAIPEMMAGKALVIQQLLGNSSETGEEEIINSIKFAPAYVISIR